MPYNYFSYMQVFNGIYFNIIYYVLFCIFIKIFIMAKKKETKSAVKQKTKDYVKAKGYRLPHGYEVVVRKTKPKK